MKKLLLGLSIVCHIGATCSEAASQEVFWSGFEPRQVNLIELVDFEAISVGSVADLDLGNGVVETHVFKDSEGNRGALYGVRYIAENAAGDLVLLLDAEGRPTLATTSVDPRRIEFSNYSESTVDVRFVQPDGLFVEELQVAFSDRVPASSELEGSLRALRIAGSAIATALEQSLPGEQERIDPFTLSALGIALIAIRSYRTGGLLLDVQTLLVGEINKDQCKVGEAQAACLERKCKERTANFERVFFLDPGLACASPAPPTVMLRRTPACRLSIDYNVSDRFAAATPTTPGCVAVSASGPGALCSGVSCATPNFAMSRLSFRDSGNFCQASLLFRTPLANGSYINSFEVGAGADSTQTVRGLLRISGTNRESHQLDSLSQPSTYLKQYDFYGDGGTTTSLSIDCLSGNFTIRQGNSGPIIESGSGRSCPGPGLFSSSSPFDGLWSPTP